MHTQKTLGRFVRPRAIQQRDRLHRWVWAVLDAAIWFVAIYGATWLRFDFRLTRVFAATTLLFAVVAVVAHFVVGALIGPYGVNHQRGSFEESADIGRSVAVLTGGLLVWALLVDPIVVPRSVTLVAGALAMTGQTAAAQPADSSGRRLTLSGNLDVANAYFLRGLPQADTEVILQPSIDGGVSVSRNLSVHVGLWNSLHTGATGLDGPSGKLWYASNFYGSLSYAAGRVAVAAIYTGYTSPNNMFASVEELAVKASHRGWAEPYALVAFELKGQQDGGQAKGRYLEVGGAPSWGSGLTLAVPVKVGLSLGDYYETFTGDETFGFFSAGGRVTKTISRGTAGSWNVHGGAEYLFLGERNKMVFGSDSKIVASAGIGFTF